MNMILLGHKNIGMTRDILETQPKPNQFFYSKMISVFPTSLTTMQQ